MGVRRSATLLVLSALSLLILVSARSAEGRDHESKEFLDHQGKCIKTGSFLDDCNNCICQKGGIPGCTYMKCHPREAHEVSAQNIPGEEEGKGLIVTHKGICLRDGSYLDSCNKCVCRKGSIPHCTNKKCLHKRDTHADKISPGGKCKPGDRWKLDECNNCVCTHTGFASCTLNECLPKKKGKRSTQQGKMDRQGKCKPGDKWQLDECNSCTCTHTGYASCTLNDCKEKKRGKRSASIGKPLGYIKMEEALQPADM